MTLTPEREYALGTMLVRLAEMHGPDNAVAMVTGMNTAYGGYSEEEAAADVHAAITRMNGTWPPPLAQAVPQPPPVAFVPPEIGCGGGSGPEVIRAVTGALSIGVIPQTYVADGQVTTVNAVSGVGDAVTRPLGVAVLAVDPALMKAMLARSTYTYRIAKDKSRNEFTPDSATLAAVLAPRNWRGLRPLRGITGSPVLRPDGTLLQDPGYDPATGLFLEPGYPSRECLTGRPRAMSTGRKTCCSARCCATSRGPARRTGPTTWRCSSPRSSGPGCSVPRSRSSPIRLPPPARARHCSPRSPACFSGRPS